jgi:mRNA interferase HigB
MIVVSLKTLNEYIKKYPEAEQSLLSWYYEAKSSEWGKPHAIKEKYGSASILKNGIVIFNIKGNNYRLAIKVNYKANVIYIKWFGTHIEYDKIDFNRI